MIKFQWRKSKLNKIEVIDQQLKEDLLKLNELNNEVKKLPDRIKKQIWDEKVYSNIIEDPESKKVSNSTKNQQIEDHKDFVFKEGCKTDRKICVWSFDDNKEIKNKNPAQDYDNTKIVSNFRTNSNSRNLFSSDFSASNSKNNEQISEAQKNFLKKRSNLKYDPMESARLAKQNKNNKGFDSMRKSDNLSCKYIHDFSDSGLVKNFYMENQKFKDKTIKNASNNEEELESQNRVNPKPKYKSNNKIHWALEKYENQMGNNQNSFSRL